MTPDDKRRLHEALQSDDPQPEIESLIEELCIQRIRQVAQDFAEFYPLDAWFDVGWFKAWLITEAHVQETEGRRNDAN